MKTEAKKKVDPQTHTPGPWKLAGVFTVMDGQPHAPECIAHVQRLEGSANINRDEESKANARLIAAAPDLLQFLKDLGESRFWRVYGSDKAEDARQSLIAKATVESA